MIKYVDNWAETQARFDAWWNHSYIDRPMLHLAPIRETPRMEFDDSLSAPDPSRMITDVNYRNIRVFVFTKTDWLLYWKKFEVQMD